MFTKFITFLKIIMSMVIFLNTCSPEAIQLAQVKRYKNDPTVLQAQARYRWFYNQEADSIDCVYIGGSSIYKFDVNVQNWKDYGFTSASLCTAAQPYEVTPYLIEETLKTQHPKLFVIELRQLIRTATAEVLNLPIYSDNRFDTYYGSVFSSMKYSLSRYKAIKSTIRDEKTAKSWIKDYKKCENVIKKYNSLDELRANVDDSTYESLTKINGISVTAYHKSINVKDFSNVNDTLKLPEKYIDSIDKLLECIEKHNVNVLFVSTPFKCKESHIKIGNFIKEYLNDKGYEYIDYCKSFKDVKFNTNTDFADSLHTNLYGAEKWTKYFGAEINDRIGKCNHTNTVSKQWDEALKNWKVYRKDLSKQLDERILYHGGY